ncbi:T9SS type B sorting domain-containing protein [Candidatus Poribacteria bacterium]|nr:T9SS type B sorting domain-containing protein [Candidatus Poribacteria bacterium]
MNMLTEKIYLNHQVMSDKNESLNTKQLPRRIGRCTVQTIRYAAVLLRWLLITILLVCLPYTICNADPSVTNLSIYPNPVSPDLHDEVTISFVLSEDPEDISVETNVNGVTVVPQDEYSAGMNIIKWPVGADGDYPVQVFVNGDLEEDGIITVDSVPPVIDNVTVNPNPFSPNGDAINDYTEINFDIIRSDNDDGIITEGLGVEIPPETEGEMLVPIPGGLVPEIMNGHLAISWGILGGGALEELDIKINGSYYKEVATSEISVSPGVTYITDEVYTDIQNIVFSGEEGNTYIFWLGWVGGSASVNIYDEFGTRVDSILARPNFIGDLATFGNYFIRWGGDLTYPDGKYIARIQVTDAAGNIARRSEAIYIDNDPIRLSIISASPNVEIIEDVIEDQDGTIEVVSSSIAKISPQNQDNVADFLTVNYYVSETAWVSAKVYDSENNLIRDLDKEIGDGEEETERETIKRGNHQICWDGMIKNEDEEYIFINPDDEDTYNLVITAVDATTQDETAESNIPVIVDNNPPAPPVIHSLPESPFGGTSIEIEGYAEPEAKVEIRMNNNLVGTLNASFIDGKFPEDSWDQVTGIVTPAEPYILEVIEGKYEISATAVDEVGNKSTGFETIELIVDHTAPVVSDDTPSGWQTSDVTVTLEAEYEDNPVETIFVNVTNINTGEIVLNGEFEESVEIEFLEYSEDDVIDDRFIEKGDGEFSIKYYGRDEVGNTGDEVEANNLVKIDRTMPEIPEDSILIDEISGTLVVQGVAIDNISGVKSVEIKISWDDYEGIWEPVVGLLNWSYSINIPVDFNNPKLNIKVQDNAGHIYNTEEIFIDVTGIGEKEQSAIAQAIPNGQIRLIWTGDGTADIYRSTSRFIDLADKTDEEIKEILKTNLWQSGASSPWIDGADIAHPTSDGTQYFYVLHTGVNQWLGIVVNADSEDEDIAVSAVADKTAPSIENITAVPSPFSPDGDRIDDFTKIFFTITEAGSVTIRIYPQDDLYNPVRNLEPVLFSMDKNFEDELSTISTVLRQRFEDSGVNLSDDAVISKTEDGLWIVEDTRKTYTIRKEGPDDSLNVYALVLNPGEHFALWDGRNDDGEYVDEGLYVYKFEKLLTKDIAGNFLRQEVSGAVSVVREPYELKEISVTPNPFSPDDDKVNDVAMIDYTITGYADYVSANIFSVEAGKQEIVARVWAECLYYVWTTNGWASRHVRDGIRAGRSDENYFLQPVHNDDPDSPPFDIRLPYPEDAKTIEDYRANYQAQNPNWIPTPFSISWDGKGAGDATTYIARIEAVKYHGAKTLEKTHGIIIESPTIVPNDKVAPIVKYTRPQKDSDFSAQISNVVATVTDGQGTGVDFANSNIKLIGPAGDPISGWMSNDGLSNITWHLDSPLADNGSEDGIYTIIISLIDFAKNRSEDIEIQFNYNASINDDIAPNVIDTDDEYPVAIDSKGRKTRIKDDPDDENIVVIGLDDEQAPEIRKISLLVEDDKSGIELNDSRIDLYKMVGSEEILIGTEKNTNELDKLNGNLTLFINNGLVPGGEDDGKYMVRIIPYDVAGNNSTYEYFFKYQTISDEIPPEILEVKLLDADNNIIVKDSEAPFDFGWLSGSVKTIRVRIQDSVSGDWVSSGFNFDPNLSGMSLVLGRSDKVEGEISYSGLSRTKEGEAKVDMLFTLSKNMTPGGTHDGWYKATLFIADNADNQLSDINITFGYDSTPAYISRSAINDTIVWVNDSQDAPVEPITVGTSFRDIEEIFVLAKDNSSGPDGCELELFSPAGSPVSLEDPVLVPREEIYEKLLEVTRALSSDVGISAGWYTMLATPVDKVGNMGETVTIKFLVDQESPLITDVDIENGTECNCIGPVCMGKYPYTNNVEYIDLTIADTGSNLAMNYMWLELIEPNSGDTINNINGDIQIVTVDDMDQDVVAGNIGILRFVLNIPLSLKGFYTIKAFVSDDVESMLFSTNNVQQSDFDILDSLILPDSIRSVFLNQGISLSENISVSVKDDGCIWLIRDNALENLDVYDGGGCKWLKDVAQNTYILKKEVINDDGNLKPTLDVFINNYATIHIPDAFFFDNVPPEVTTIKAYYQGDEIDDDEFDSITASLRDEDSGLDYELVSLVLKDETGLIIPGSLLIDQDEESITWKLEDELDLDSDDIYIVEYAIHDMAGNEEKLSADLRAYLSSGKNVLAPTIVSVFPEDESLVGGPNQIITQVIAYLKDNSGTGIDYERSYIDVDAPSKAPDWWKIKGYQSYDETQQAIIWNFNQSLATDGRGDGEYEVNIRAYDNEGHKSDRMRVNFYYDSQPPEVEKLEIGSRPWTAVNYEPLSGMRKGGTSRELNRCVVKLDDELASIDFDKSDVEIEGPNGVLETSKSNDGIDTLVIDFPTLSRDGEDDGLYLIKVTAVDSLGNANPFPHAEPYVFSFIYDTTSPGVVESEPEADSTRFSKLEKISIKLDDSTGVGNDLATSAATIFVYGPEGPVEGKRNIEYIDGDEYIIYTLDNPLSVDDSTDDGEYRVTFMSTDWLGNQSSVEYTFEYNAVGPELVNVYADTAGEIKYLETEDKPQISITQKGLSIKAVLKDRSGSGIDFDSSFIFVEGPGVSSEDTLNNNGVDVLTYIFAESLNNDGTDDGRYMVLIRGADRDGHWVEYEPYIFMYDTSLPRVVETIPEDGSIFNVPIEQVMIKLEDMTGVDVANSEIRIEPDIPAEKFFIGDDTIGLEFFNPQQEMTDGIYTIKIKPLDILGNGSDSIEKTAFKFTFDTSTPKIMSSDPFNGEIITSPLDRMEVILSDGTIGSGIDLSACDLSLIGPDGSKVTGNLQKLSAEDILANENASPLVVRNWSTVKAQLPSADGTGNIMIDYYVISGEIENRSGSVKEKIRVNVSAYDANGRMVSSGSSDVKNPVVPGDIDPGSVSNFSVWIEETGGEETFKIRVYYIDPEDEREKLGGETLGNDAALVFNLDEPLATDGSDDGTYMMRILTQDNVGNVSPAAVRIFTYNTRSAALVSTTPADGAKISQPIRLVSAVLDDNSGTGLDLQNSSIKLVKSDGQTLAGEPGFELPNIISFTLQDDLKDDGNYKLEIKAVDKTGISAFYTTGFTFDTTPPVIRSTWPADGSMVKDSISYVSARLEDIGSGVDLEKSVIDMIGPDGAVSGSQSNDGVDTIKWEFDALVTDSSHDGEYIITVIPVDEVGNIGTEQEFSFIYDTNPPFVVESTPEANTTIVDELSSVSVELDDGNGTGVDIRSSEIKLYNPSGKETQTIRSTDGVSVMTLTFPTFATDGSADGQYTIKVIPKDKAGNTGEIEVPFNYSALAPELVDVEVVSEDAVLSLASNENRQFERSVVEVRVTLKDRSRSGNGLDFSQSMVVVEGPGVSDNDILTHNSIDTITYTFAIPLANDGTDDGEYMVYIKAVDNDGQSAQYKAGFVYDSTAPYVVAIQPKSKQTRPPVSDVPTPVISESFDSIKVKLGDKYAGVDLFESKISLSGPVVITGEQVNNGVDTVTFRFFQLPEDGTADGLYEISVSPVDILGNELPEPILYEFIYDTAGPKITSTQPAGGSVITSWMSEVKAVLSDGISSSSAGLELGSCFMELLDPDGVAVAGDLNRQEPDTLIYTLDESIIPDDYKDGSYTIRVTAQDKVGNSSKPTEIKFSYITKAPAVISTTPANNSNQNKPPVYITATMQDNSGSGLDLESSRIELVDLDGEMLNGTLEVVQPDSVRLKLQENLATDSSDDGVYTIKVTAVDNSGVTTTYEGAFIYDTLPPVVDIITPADSSILNESIESVSAKLIDFHTGVDLERSEIRLMDVEGRQVDNGVDTIKFTFDPLTEDGVYNIQVTPQDNIGNMVAEAKGYSFIYDTAAPKVVSVTPEDGSTVVYSLDRVSIQAQDFLSGVDMENSTIQLVNPAGNVIPGIREDNSESMILTFSPLHVDGSVNGKYTVSVTLYDKAGNESDEEQFSFTYMPTAPTLVSVTPWNGAYLSEPVETVEVKLGDKSGTGVDLENSSIRLLDPQGQEITGNLTDDGIDAMTFELQYPFANDGSDDGEYTIDIKAVDNTGNTVSYTPTFVYDTTPAVVDAVYVDDVDGIELESDIQNIIPVEALPLEKIIALVSDSGSGVNLSECRIELIDKEGMDVEATQHNNGVDTLILDLNELALDGEYTVRVTASDKLGNISVNQQTYRFLLDSTPPELVSASPGDGSSVVNVKLSEASVTISDNAGSGVDENSLVAEAYGPDGKIPGSMEYSVLDDGNVLMSYVFESPLAMDGSVDGSYTVKVWFADKAGNSIHEDGASIHFSYDTVQPGGPVVSNLGAFPLVFSPNADGTYDNTTISYGLSKDASVRAIIYNDQGQSVKILVDWESRTAGMNDELWDGTDNNSELLPDGSYVVKVDAVDDMGLTGAVESTNVGIDTHPPSVDNPIVSNNPFTPDGDGFSDSTTITFTVSGSEGRGDNSELRDSVSVSIFDKNLEKVATPDLNRAFDGDGEYWIRWDGSGADEDGEYTYVITARDVAGNIREVSGTVSMDKDAPAIEMVNPDGYSLITNQQPVIISGTAQDWSGVRSVSLSGSFIPKGSSTTRKDPINNWVNTTFSGDKVDNDNDGSIDEEAFDGIDNDSDGLVDEDLIPVDNLWDPVYWIYKLKPQGNGDYIIKLRATDSINHSSVVPDNLRIKYDTAPPLHTGTDIDVDSAFPSEPGAKETRVRNGETVTIRTHWDELDYNVSIDLSQLDSAVTEPVEMESLDDGEYILTHVVSDDNTKPDGFKNLIITAEDSAGNVTVYDDITLRLRNNLPSIVDVSSDRPAYSNGSNVKLTVVCDAPDLKVTADFSQLDSNYIPEAVETTNNGDNTYTVEYTISQSNLWWDRPDASIVVTASDGVEYVTWTYKVALDNLYPVLTETHLHKDDMWHKARTEEENTLLSGVSFADGDPVTLRTKWDMSDYTLKVDFSNIDSGYTSGSEETEADEAGTTYTTHYEISSSNTIPDGEYAVIISAEDKAGNLVEYKLMVKLDNTAPGIMEVRNADDDNIYKNGDTVTLSVVLDDNNYNLTGDFSPLDSTYPVGLKQVKEPVSNGDGTFTYTLKYAISNENTKAANGVVTGIPITVTATDVVGNSSSDSRIEVDLDNLPPELVIEKPVTSGAAPSVEVLSARIEIKGHTESDALVTVAPRGYINASTEISVDKNGNFSCLVSLKVGENIITVSALDEAGNQALEKLSILYRPLIKSADGGTVFLPEKRDDNISDNDTRIEVSSGAVDRDFTVHISHIESPEPAENNPDIGPGSILPLVAYEFDLMDENGEKDFSDTFTSPATLYLQYQGMSNINGNLAVFRWDGVRWNKIGGQTDKNRDNISVTVNALSIFGIFEVSEVPGEFKLLGANPNPFTPNNDGINDTVSFYFNNPDNKDSIIRIFDLRGKLVRRLENGFTTWDGLDDEGQPVEMGVYVYQIEVDGEVKGNTIVLAR